MNRGVMYKAVRETWLNSVLFGFALLAIEAILAYVLPTLEGQFKTLIAQLPLIQTIFKALLGTDIGPGLGAEGIQSIAWVHPVVLTIVWAHAIVICTRVPAGEVDRGTADVLFGLPVSRWNIHVSEAVIWLLAIMFVLLLGLVGHRIGSAFAANAAPAPLPRLLVVQINLLCMALAVGGVAWLMSAFSDRRGMAIAAVFAIVLASFLLNFLGQFWAPAQKVAFLGILNYYRPYEIIRSGAFPVGDIGVLIAAGAAAWALAGLIMSRRDIATV